MPWSIKADKDRVVVDGWVDIVVHDDKGKQVDLMSGDASVAFSPAGTATFAGPATVWMVKEMIYPLTNKVVTIQIKDPTNAVVAHQDIEVFLPWLARGPKLVNSLGGVDPATALSWDVDDPKVRRAKLIVHDVLEQLPDVFLQPLEGMCLVRSTRGDKGGEYEIWPAFPTGYVWLSDAWIQLLTDPTSTPATGDPPTDKIDQHDRALAQVLVHELSHAWITHQCNVVLMGLQTLIDFLIGWIGGWIYQIGAAVAAILCPPAFLMIAVKGALTGTEHIIASRDEMSDWCDVSNWRQRGLAGLRVPLIGWLLASVFEESPNIVTCLSTQLDATFLGEDFGLAANWAMLDVHNTRFDVYEVHRKANQDSYFAHPEAVPALIKNSGLVSPYAALSAQEDFAESSMVMALRLRGALPKATLLGADAGTKPSDPLMQPNSNEHGAPYAMPDAGRLSFFAKHQLFQDGDPDIVIGAGETLAQLTTLKGWSLETIEPDAASQAAAAAEAKVLSGLSAAAKAWSAGPAPTFAKADTAIRALTSPAPDPASPFSFWTALECHGDGLAPLGDNGKGAVDGDVALAADQKTHVVYKADDTGVRALIAAPREGMSPAGGKVAIADLKLRYRWPPDAKPRAFCPDKAHGPGWTDIESQLRTVIGWWGQSSLPVAQAPAAGPPAGQPPDKGSRAAAGGAAAAVPATPAAAGDAQPLDRLDGFGDALLGVIAAPAAPDIQGQRTAAKARLHGLGDGLAPFDPKAPARIGDVVMTADGNTLGVVTRLDTAGRPLDVARGGGAPAGPLGEDPGAVRMDLRLDHRDLHYLWRPSAQPRSFKMPDAPATSLTDLDHSLGWLVAHHGATSLRRQEEDVGLDEGLAVLAGLLAEGEPDAGVRRALDLGVQDDDQRVLNRAVAFGEPRGRPAAVSPGDLLLAADGSAAAVVAAPTNGGPAQTARVNRLNALAVDAADLGPQSATLAWRLSTQPRPAGSPAPFYGDRGLAWLYGAPARLDGQMQTSVALEGDQQQAMLHLTPALADVLAGQAPARVRRRLWTAADLDDV